MPAPRRRGLVVGRRAGEPDDPRRACVARAGRDRDRFGDAFRHDRRREDRRSGRGGSAARTRRAHSLTSSRVRACLTPRVTPRTIAVMRMVVVGLAVLAAAPAVATDVHIGINIGTPPVAVAPPPPPPPVVLAAPPPLEVIPRSPVYYAPSVPYSFFYYDGLYYVYHDSSWFFSLSSN